MKRTLLAAALAAAAAGALAQAPTDVPPPRCEPKPVVPGREMLKDRMVKRMFDADLKAYKDCMTAYLDQRKAAIKAHEQAANDAINEYNAVMKALNEAQGVRTPDPK